MRLALRYALFAVLATAINIAGQFVALRLLPAGIALPGSVLVGTAAGLLSKYWLDKHYIFAHRTNGLAEDGRLFLLYSLMGVVTTAIFWGSEWLFHLLFATEAMRYVGAVLGLAIGYVCKYLLDRRYVFATP